MEQLTAWNLTLCKKRKEWEPTLLLVKGKSGMGETAVPALHHWHKEASHGSEEVVRSFGVMKKSIRHDRRLLGFV